MSSSQEINEKAHLLPTYEHLLQQYMPAGFLVDDQLELVHTFPGAERYLQLRSGPASTSLLDMLLDELKMPASGVLQHALRENKRSQLAGTAVRSEGREERVRLSVQPLPHAKNSRSYVLLTIETLAEAVSDRAVDPELQVDEMNQERINAP